MNLISTKTAYDEGIREERNPPWEHFLQAMASPLVKRSEGEVDYDDISPGLEIFLTLPFSKSASLFLINPETFEFYHQASFPLLDDALAQKQFSMLVDQGVIATALNSNQSYITYSQSDIMSGNHLFILPLTVPSEIIGLLLISTSQSIEYWDPALLPLCLLQGRQLATSIKNKTLINRLRANDDEAVLRQKIAGRTQNLEQAKRELTTVLDSIKTGILIIDKETHLIINANETALEIMGRPKEAILGFTCHSFCLIENGKCPFSGSPVNGSLEHSETTLTKADGEAIPILKTLVSVTLGGRTCFIESFVDITERKHLENQFHQSQKLEAIGRLAGGVAHDFNNLLMAIMGYCELTFSILAKDTQPRHYLEEINKAAERAASLTRQLLALSRKQVMQPQILDLNSVLSDIKKMLLRLIGEDIELITHLDQDLGQVKADKGQLEQVIMNLTVNARDAMPHGGKLIFETTKVEIDQRYYHRYPMMTSGEYVLLSVSDTGEGMDKETQAHIFEPFFTTKGAGKGTGLGLSTVYGIVKQSGGYIWVNSELGKGTTFDVFLPRVSESVENTEKAMEPVVSHQGSETILLVEDEALLRSSIKKSLEINGYKVLAASNGNEALSISETHRDPIHLVLTDVVMPGMNGQEVAESLTLSHPEVKVIFMSGYTDNAVLRQKILNKKSTFLQKPITPKALATKVREILDLPLQPQPLLQQG